LDRSVAHERPLTPGRLTLVENLPTWLELQFDETSTTLGYRPRLISLKHAIPDSDPHADKHVIGQKDGLKSGEIAIKTSPEANH
jgi:hypothetical protein